MQIEATPSPHEYSAPNRTISTRAPGHVTKADGVATGFETVDDKGSIGDTDPRPPCIMGVPGRAHITGRVRRARGRGRGAAPWGEGLRGTSGTKREILRLVVILNEGPGRRKQGDERGK